MRNVATLSVCLSLALFAVPAAGQDKPSFSGTWQLDPSKSEMHNVKMSSATWVIDEGDNSIHITETDAKSKKIELQCSTDGKECPVTGDKAKASFWYNGPMLVEMETKGDHVVRYRMKISDDAKTFTVDITHIVPQLDKIDTLVFTK